MTTWKSWPLPEDAGRKNSLAWLITDVLYREPSETTLEVSAWDIFPSCNNQELFDQSREFRGEGRSLSEANFHVFTNSEKTEFRNLLNLCLLFFYDVKVHKLSNGDRVFASHDEFIDLVLCDAEDRQ